MIHYAFDFVKTFKQYRRYFYVQIELINNIFDYSTSKTTLKYLGLTYQEIVNQIFDYSNPKMTLKYLGIDKEIK